MDTETLEVNGTSNNAQLSQKSVAFEIAAAAIVIALAIILGRMPGLGIITPYFKITLSFVPLMIGAIILRPYTTILVFCLQDIIGANLFPSGPFDIRFTLVALLSGTILGCFLGWQNLKGTPIRMTKKYWAKLITSSVLVTLGCNLIINTYLIWLLYGGAVNIFVPYRVVREIVYLFLHIGVGIAVVNLYAKVQHRYD